MTFDPMKHPAEYQPTMVSKLAAGRRQLDCAIEMWFADKDPVAVHTLACAAHQIIHDIHAHKFPDKPLFLNTPLAKEEYRAKFISIFKDAPNFFKHADRNPDPSSTIEFSPFITQVFFIYATFGLASLGEVRSDVQLAHMMWFSIHHPYLASPDFVELMHNSIPIKHLEFARSMKKREFLQAMLEAAVNNRVRG
jgi:hypothetical protein